MRKLLLFAFLFISVNSFSQVENVYVPKLQGGQITGMAVKDNYLYFGTYDQNTIYKINLADSPNQSPIAVVSNISGVMDLQFNGNDLYISQFNGGTIKKVDVSLPNPILVDVLSGVSAPAGLQFYNNYLYIGEAYGYTISRINLNLTNPTKEVVVPYSNSPWKMQIFGNELYVAETYGNKISKLNLLDVNPVLIDVVANITSPYCMYIKDNFLYFEINNPNQAKLSKIDLTSSNPTPINTNITDWFSNNSSSRWIINNNYLYRSTQDKIVKYKLNTLGLNNIDYEKNAEIFPNPATDFITIKNLQKEENVTIINNLGQIIKNEKIHTDGILNIQNLERGIYYIKTENLNTYKLLKN